MRNITILILLTYKLCGAQQSCPSGYELRQVKCNGQLIQKCLPANKTCTLCWIVEYPPCPGTKTGGMTLHNSYQSAEKSAINEGSEVHRTCSFYDNSTYKIYTDDCPRDVTTGNPAVQDLKNKVIPFLK